MAEDKSPALEPLQKSAQAASMIKSAVKTGKAIAGAAKGAAAGGPVGAAVGFLWSNRKLVGKILIAAIALLMIPIMFLCMLPGLIFGGFDSATSEYDPDSPILNSSTAITEHANEICLRVDGILSEALANTVADIHRNYSRSNADQMDIVNPYAAEISYDATRLVCMYCAMHNEDYASISADDMEQMLRRHMGQLFSYTYEDETRQVMTTDPDTGAQVPAVEVDPDTGIETPITEVWRIYTITYNGDSYFASQVFVLSDEQKALANDYASNLNLFLQDSRFNGSINPAYQRSTIINISQYTDPATKNNRDLVVWAIEAEKNHWGYVCGTFGQVLDSSLYEAKLRQYPEEVGRYSQFITSNWLGGRTADCVGLIKGYGWLNVETLNVGYGTNGMPDIGADTMYYNATEKGPISSIPEIPGLAVWHAGHIGIYIGNGEVIEAMGTKYGVVRTQLEGSRWTHWLKIPYISYS